jgi:quercetin dioxygenase-like cupin family protein
MAHPGDVLEHPAFGVRMTFLQTTEETNGELLRVEVVLPPRFSMAEHVHPRQEERHCVLSGTLTARVGGEERQYKVGEQVIGPPNVPHAWRNASGDENLRLLSEHRPVLHMELMLEAGSAIARDFEANKRSALKQLLRMAVLMDEIKDDFYFTGLPMRVLMAALVALAPVGRGLGYRMEYQDFGGHAAQARREGRHRSTARPIGLNVVAVLMVIFGVAEVATGFTHSFLGLISTAEGTGSTYGGAGIGALYALGGFFLFANRTWTLAVTETCLVLVILGRLLLVASGLYPVDSFLQTFSIITGSAIAVVFAIYVGMEWRARREGSL